MDQCGDCGHQRISYNSCRNRHCPKCQGLNQQTWVQAREADLLPVPYYHLVFTIPDALNGLCLVNPRELYHLLFRAAWETVRAFAADPKYLGAATGMVAVLHTWGQNLSLHPHVHAIVPGGGLTPQGDWRMAKGKSKFLFPVKAMSKVFRGKFVQGLRKLFQKDELRFSGKISELADDEAFTALLRSLYQRAWVVFAKRPFAGPEQVVRYLGRYTHRIALTNHRIKAVKNGQVLFSWKDYRKGAKKGVISLSTSEFLRRFCLHIFPPNFVRLRHYGLLSARNKTQALAAARRALKVKAPEPPPPLDWKAMMLEATGLDVDTCPCCEAGRMEMLRTFAKGRSPPSSAIAAV